MNIAQESRQFGKKESKIIVSRNGQARVYKISTSFLIVAAIVITVFFSGYVGATAYLAFREDLVASSMIRQARMRHEYEDRIAALRSEVDRITSRQLLDQQAVEAKVNALMQQQEMLSGRNGALDNLLDKARKNGIDLQKNTSNVDKRAQLKEPSTLDLITTGSIVDNAGMASGSIMGFADMLRGSSIAGRDSQPVRLGKEQVMIARHTQTRSLPSKRLFGNVRRQIAAIENNQRNGLIALQNAITSQTDRVARVYRDLNISIPGSIKSGIGGPYITRSDLAFEDMTDNIANSLQSYEKLKQNLNSLPLSNPVPGGSVSSRFGNRLDPFRRTTAFHAGLDFKARHGTPVKASGAGKVTFAGRKGGYGLMVEIDHGRGFTTRYAHLSRIGVRKGHWVANGKTIGKVGSTGRSTGPHLHYEIRRSDKPANPARYLRVGRKLQNLL